MKRILVATQGTGKGNSRTGKNIVPAIRSGLQHVMKLAKGELDTGSDAALQKLVEPKMTCVGDDAKKGFKREVSFFHNYGAVFYNFFEKRTTGVYAKLEAASTAKDIATKDKAIKESMELLNS